MKIDKKWIFLICTLVYGSILHAQSGNLDYYLKQGLENSPLLKDYRNQMSANLVDSEKIKAIYKPQINANSTNSYAPVINGWGYDEAITNGKNINAVLGFTQTLVSKKTLQTQFESVNLLNKGLDNTSKISEQDLKRTITAQYITTYGDEEQVNFLKETYQLLKEEDEVLKKLTRSNVYRQTDYLIFLVTLQQQELATAQADIQLQNDFATLNYICGTNDTSVLQLEKPALITENTPSAENSVFFTQYAIDSLSLINQKAVVDMNYRPKINLFGDVGYNSTLLVTPYKNIGYSFGVSLNIPIYDGGQRKLDYRKLAIAEETRTQYKDFFRRQYDQQLAQLQQQLHATQNMIEQINHQIKYANGLIKANTKLLATGDAKIADLVIAINNYLTARNLLTQNKVSSLLIVNQMNYWNH